MKRQWWVYGFIVGSLWATRPATAQQGPVGTVTGTVTDADTKTPVSDVTVLVVGQNRAGRTNSEGHFRIVNVPVGTQQLRAARLGYAPLVQPVTVADGGTANVDFQLHTTSTTLTQVVITGTATQNQQARENGSSVGVIAVDSIPQGPITDFSDLLNSRNPGLTIEQNAGTVGTGSRIDIRGVSTTGTGAQALNSQPVIIVDGVRAYNDLRGFNDLGGLGGQLVSRFDDLDHEDIQDVQVLKGPAAAALYGTEAANGVIVISTKHGEIASAPRWHLFGNLGSNNNQTTYPLNYARPELGGGGVPNSQTGSCSLEDELGGFCQGNTGKLGATPATSYNLFQASGPFHQGYDEGAGASVNGGSAAVTYFLGANWDRQQGIYHNNADRWTHLSTGLSLHPYDQLDLGISAQYTQRRTILPLSDNAIGGVLSGMLLGGAAPNSWFAGLSPAVVERQQFHADADRFTIGSNGTFRILPWLSAVGNVGVDYVNTYNNFYQSQLLEPQLAPKGQADAGNADIFVYTGSASLNGSVQVLSSLKSTTTFGGEWIDQTIRETIGTGQGLLPGTGSLNGATSSFTASETNQDIVDIGGYLQEQLGWRNVLFGTIAGRLDGNSAFGRGKSIALYPAGNISYNISDERYWPKNDLISTLRYRIAAGQSGREPLFRQANGSFVGASYKQFLGTDAGGVIPNTYGNADLKPERTSEYETGFDIGLFRERVTLTATAYDKLTTDLVQTVPVDISTGVGAGPPTSVVYTNIGKVDNRGLELGLSGTVYQSFPLTVEFNSTFALNRNKLISTGSPTPIVIAGGVTGIPIQQDVPGLPIGGFWASKYTVKPSTGAVTAADLVYGGTGAATYVGQSYPREEFTFGPTITLFRYLRLNALFDRRDGFTVYDATDAFRCIVPFQVGQECNDPTAPVKNQAAAVALNGNVTGATQSEYGYLLNGSFWKVREVTFTLSAPDSWSRRFLGGRTASISISGRNLATWTNYRGLDPEINQNGPDLVTSSQFFTQPPTRLWVARIDMTW